MRPPAVSIVPGEYAHFNKAAVDYYLDGVAYVSVQSSGTGVFVDPQGSERVLQTRGDRVGQLLDIGEEMSELGCVNVSEEWDIPVSVADGRVRLGLSILLSG